MIDASPKVGKCNEYVAVKWKSESDGTIKWEPSPNDELRLYNTTGILISHELLWNTSENHAQRLGEISKMGDSSSEEFTSGSIALRLPPFPNWYVLCIYDSNLKRRVFTQPYRVEGETEFKMERLFISRRKLHCLERLDLTIPDELIDKYPNSFIAVYPSGQGDNDGVNQVRQHSLSSCVLSFSGRVSSIIAPSREGKYVIRLMVTPKLIVPLSVAESDEFEVELQERKDGIPRVEGIIKAQLTNVFVGQRMTVEWNFYSGGELMHELDCFLFHTYGRPEMVKQTDSLINTIGVPSYTGSLVVRAPDEPGTYEIGYFSFMEARFLVTGPLINVLAADAAIEVDKSGTVGEPFEVRWSVSSDVFTIDDRWRCYTEDMSLYGSGPLVDWQSSQREKDVGEGKGTLKIVYDRPGSFIITYWSVHLQAEIGKTRPFEITGTSQMVDMTVEFLCPVNIPLGVPISIDVMVGGEDSRGIHTRMNDSVGLYYAGERDYCGTQYFDDAIRSSRAMQRISTHGDAKCTLVFDPPGLEGTYEFRYMTDTGHLCQSTVFKCTFNVIDDKEEKLRASFHLPMITDKNQYQNDEKSLPFSFYDQVTRESAPTTHTVLLDEHAYTAPGKHMVGRAVLSRKSKLQQDLSRVGPDFLNSSTASHVASYTPTHNMDILPFFNLDTEFTGSILTPGIIIVNTVIVVTYHITSGLPLPSDLLVLLDDDRRQRVYSCSEIMDSIGRQDLSLGSIMLRAPEKVGMFVVAYFSTKHRSLVLASKPFKVVMAGGGTGQAKKISRHTTLTKHIAVREASKLATQDDSKDVERHHQWAIKEVSTVDFSHLPAARSKIKAVLCAVTYKQCVYELNGTINDVDMLRKALIHQQSAEPECILVLCEDDTERQPTAVNIRRAMRWLTYNVQPGDKLLFHFSGHGSVIRTLEGSAEECIVPCDNDWDLRCITMKEVFSTLFETVPEGVHVSITADCSHVGCTRDCAVQRRLVQPSYQPRESRCIDAVRAKRIAKGVDADYRCRYLFPPHHMFDSHDQSYRQNRSVVGSLFHPFSGVPPPEKNKHGMNYVRASQIGQGSLEAFVGGSFHGLFSWALASTLLESKNVPWGELLNTTSLKIHKSGYEQFPKIMVSDIENLQMVFP